MGKQKSHYLCILSVFALLQRNYCTSSFVSFFVPTTSCHHQNLQNKEHERTQNHHQRQVLRERGYFFLFHQSNRNNNDNVSSSLTSSPIIFSSSDFYLPSSLTIILPAYNEEHRISQTIEKYYTYLYNNIICSNNNNSHVDDDERCHCHILVVDDGSNDSTCNVIERLKTSLQIKYKQTQNIKKCNTSMYSSNSCYCRRSSIDISYISLHENQGKGFAISSGINEIQRRVIMNNFSSNNISNNEIGGHVVLIADADGSGNIESLGEMMIQLWNLLAMTTTRKTDIQPSIISESMTSNIWDSQAMIVGNRGYGDNTSLISIRKITRWGFRAAVKLICGDLTVKDSQCGFKLLTLPTGCVLYKDLHLKRWTNDVEVLYRAKILNVPVMDVDIKWVDMDGSKLASSLMGITRVSLVMLFEILWMRLQYLFGRWTF